MNIVSKKVTMLDVISGKSYFLFKCGQSAKHLLCDGSHKNTSLNPEKYVATADTSTSVCGCNKYVTVIRDCA